MNRGALIAIAVIAGCASQPEATRYYLLEPAMPGASVALSTEVRELAVGPVTVSAYLDQSRIVTRARDDVVQLREDDRWAMPLEDSARELILRRLAERLPNTNVTPFPGTAELSQAARRVAIDIFRLDGSINGEATLAAQWRVFDPNARTWSATQRFTESTVVTGTAIRDLVAAHGVLLESLADTIAQSL
jgi:uncharacterized lipoprotein YmbA